MIQLSDRQAYTVAGVCGALLWLLTAAASGRREAWDSSLYWMLAYPAGLLIAGVLGYLAPRRPWRWGFTLMLVQAVTLAATAASFGLLPLGLIMFGVLALPLAGVAVIAGSLRR